MNSRTTKLDVAHKLGISRVTLDAFLRRNGAPVASDGEYNLDEVAAFILSESAPTREPVRPSIVELKILKEKLRCEKIAHKLQVENGELISKAKIGPAITNLCLRFRLDIQRKMEDELPPKLVGLTEAEIAQEFSKCIDELFDSLERGLEQILHRN